MSEHTQLTNKRSKPEHLSAKDWAKMTTAVAAVALAGVGVVKANNEKQPHQPAINEPRLMYAAKPGDTEWSIGSRAYPNLDQRAAADLIDEQNPNENHLVTPGQKFTFGTDAELGKLVSPDGERIEIGSAITGQYDQKTGKTKLVETDQEGNTTTTIEP